MASDSCVIQMGNESTMNENDLVDVGKAEIFRVRKPLRESDRFYSPKLVSIGPFHYGKEELQGMEKFKCEAIRRMQKRVEKKYPDSFIRSFVEKDILPKDKEIREFYVEDLSYNPVELAWMLARDACFIFEFLVNYVGCNEIGRRFYKEEVTAFELKNDAVFNVNYQNPMRGALMDDILLLENQIPLWVLKDLVKIKIVSPAAANEKLDELMDLVHGCAVTHNVFMWYTPYEYNTSCHVLEVLYHGMLERNVGYYKDGVALASSLSSNTMQIWIEKGVDSMKDIRGRWRKKGLGPHKGAELVFLKLPTASELARQGVKIHAVSSQDRPTKTGSAIQWIRFDEKTSTLYLPQMSVTAQSDSVMRNIIAMEVNIEKRYSPKPFTQFAIFMDELIDKEEDVAVLRKANVINNYLGSDQEVADLFNSVAKGIERDYGCKVIVDAREGLHTYTRKMYKILWSEFVSAYFSRPSLVTGSIAATLVLALTAAQVFCSFFSCNPGT